MLGFLETGKHLGIRYSSQGPGDRDEHFVLQILDDDGWKIANDSRQLPLEELREKYPEVETLVSTRLLEYQENLSQLRERLQKGQRLAEPSISIVDDRSTLLCTVVSVGD
jgi:hypothetical protein